METSEKREDDHDETRTEGRAQTERRRENETFLDSLHNKTQLNITNKSIRRWTVLGEQLYFSDTYKSKIVVYSVPQRRIERELQHENDIYDFAFVGDRFLIAIGAAIVEVRDVSDGTLLTLEKHGRNHFGYKTCIAVSPNSFLHIAPYTIRRLEITTSHSTPVQLEQVNTSTFNEHNIFPSEVCGTKIALVFQTEKKLKIFDVVTFKVTALLDLSPHLMEAFELENGRKFDVSFPDRVVLCVGDSKHSELKLLILDPANLDLQNSFTIPNPIHSTLARHSKIRKNGKIWMDASKSRIKIQYYCDTYYQILDIAIEEEKLTSSLGFRVKKSITPNCKSLCNEVIAADQESNLILAGTSNKLEEEILNNSTVVQGPIEKLYHDCIRTGARAIQFCEQLSPNLFNGSLLEFYSAHRLLMMAVQDGDVQRSLHHNGVDFKWHKVIYAESRNVNIESTEDEKEITLILKEAAKFNIIETVGQFLLANQILAEVRHQNEKFFNTGKQLFLRIIQLEAAHMNLDIAFDRYKKVQGMTELMGIAINVIPFLGGSVAAAVTAGAELIEGLQISDVMDGALQVSIDMISNSSTFEQGVLRCVENSLRKEEIKKRVELLRSLENCGVTIDQLQDILKNGIHRKEDEEDEQHEGSNFAENSTGNLGQSSTGNSGKSDDEWTAEECYVEGNMNSTEEDDHDVETLIHNDDAKLELELENLEQWKLSEFRKLSEDRGLVRSLSITQCSFFLAALMLLFDDVLDDEFGKLQTTLFEIVKSRMISGKVLCEYDRYSKTIDGILDDLKKRYVVNDIMIGEFMDFVKK